MNNSQEVKNKLIECYLEIIAETGSAPTVRQLCKKTGITEKEFFQLFPSVEAVESEHWWNVMDHTIRCCESSSEWSAYNSQQRILAFYYRFFDDALAHRSLLLMRFSNVAPHVSVGVFEKALRRLREFFCAILNQALREKQIADRGRIQDLYAPAFVFQFRTILSFHLRDESPGFEKTDAFVEKSVRFAFELLRTSVVESAFDLARWVLTQRQGAFARETAKNSSCGV